MSFPPTVAKFFWGDNLAEMSFEQHGVYITQTLLEKGDSLALQWLFSHQSPQKTKSLLPKLKLSKKSANFWQIYLS